MPAGGLIVSAVIGIASLTVGAVQKSHALKNQAIQAAAQQQQALYIANQKANLCLEIAAGKDISSIISAVATADMCQSTQLKLQRQQQEGDALIIFGVATTVVTLGLLIFRHKQTAT